MGRGIRQIITERKSTVLQWEERGFPSIVIYLVGTLNLVGALFIIVGFLVPIVSLFFSIFMASTIYVQRYVLKRSYFGHGVPSYELNIIYFLMAVLFLVIGGGPFSIDSALGF